MWDFVIARADGFNELSRTFRRPSTTTSDNLFLLCWIGLIVGFWVALYYFDKWRKSRKGQGGSAKSLFSELCVAHGLSWHERSLLMKAVHRKSGTDPAAVFVDPRILEQCIKAPAFDTQTYTRLSQKLFGNET